MWKNVPNSSKIKFIGELRFFRENVIGKSVSGKASADRTQTQYWNKRDDNVCDVVYAYCGGLLISAVMLTGGTIKYGPPPDDPQQLATSAGAGPRFCGPSRNAAFLAATPPAVTMISGRGFGVSVHSLTPTVTRSTAVRSSNAASSPQAAACSCCTSTAAACSCGSFSGSRAVIATGCRPAAASSRLTASRTRTTRSGRSYGSRTTGNTGLGIKRRRHTSGAHGRDSRRCSCRRRPGSCCRAIRPVTAAAAGDRGTLSGRGPALETTAGRRCRRRRWRRCRWTSSALHARSARPVDGAVVVVVDEIASCVRRLYWQTVTGVSTRARHTSTHDRLNGRGDADRNAVAFQARISGSSHLNTYTLSRHRAAMWRRELGRPASYFNSLCLYTDANPQRGNERIQARNEWL